MTPPYVRERAPIYLFLYCLYCTHNNKIFYRNKSDKKLCLLHVLICNSWKNLTGEFDIGRVSFVYNNYPLCTEVQTYQAVHQLRKQVHQRQGRTL